MAKPRANQGARTPAGGDSDKKKQGKTKLRTVKKKPFKKQSKKPPKVLKPDAKVASGAKVAGVKRTQSQDTEKINKKQKLTAPTLLDRKERRVLRKSHRPLSELTSGTKGLWEKLRRHDLKGDDKMVVMEKLMTLLSGHMYKLSLKHDTARVVQSCLKNGNSAQRTIIFTELREHVVELSKLKYAKFTVKALLKYCTSEERGHVIAGLYGNVRKLIRHTEAAEIVETAYNDYANAGQRASLVQELYGPTFALFKEEQLARPLTQILAESSEHKESILKYLKESLVLLCQKTVIKHSIIHRALLDYFLCCDDKDRADMIEHLREVVVNILHTREGAKVTLMCLWHGTTKDRKLIVKSFKNYVRKICAEETGHVVLLGLFDCVDDTVLVSKALLSEVVSELAEICADPHGRHVVLYLLSPRSPRHFSPQFLNLLTPGDQNTHSKKTMSTRWKELLGGVAEPLVALATKQATDWCRSKPLAPLLLEVVKALQGVVDLCPLYEVLLAELGTEFTDDHLITHACGHWVLRRLLEVANNEENSPTQSEFAVMLLARVSAEQVQMWVGSNRGAFVVSSLLMSGVDGVKGRLTSMLEPVMPMLKEAEFKGQEALLNELTKLQT